MLPLSPGRIERQGFEYHRHGTLSLYAALNTRTGEAVGHTAARHTSDDFLAFLASSWRRTNSSGQAGDVGAPTCGIFGTHLKSGK